VNLDLAYRSAKRDYTQPAMEKILPLISSICSIVFCDFFDWVHSNDKETQLLLKTMVAQTRILAIHWF
jgi:uncharacterized membrane protein